MNENTLDIQEDTAEAGTVSDDDIEIYQDVSGNAEIVVVPDVSGGDIVVYPENTTVQSSGLDTGSSEPVQVLVVNDNYVTHTDFYVLLLMFATLLCYLVIHDIFINLFNMRRYRRNGKRKKE